VRTLYFLIRLGVLLALPCSIVSGQQKLPGVCDSKVIRAAVANYLATSAQTNSVLPPKIVSIESSAAKGVCIAKLEFSLSRESPSETENQLMYLSSDGRYIFPSFVDLATRTKEGFLKAVVVEGFPNEGRPNSPVLIVEYSDFQCPPCRQSGLDVRKSILSEYVDKVQWTYKWLPLPSHNWAKPAALGTACVFSQSPTRFWDLHGILLSQQSSMSVDSLHAVVLGYAGHQGLDLKKLNDCLTGQDKMGQNLLTSSKSEAVALGVFSTPTIFVNGKKVLFPTNVENLRDAINRELADVGNKTRPE